MKKLNLTSTFTSSKSTVVPWLASIGPLSYTPKSPPDRDYYFQYSWIIPKIFNEKVNLRQHRHFGCYSKDHYIVNDLFDFWNNYRRGIANEVSILNGKLSEEETTSPIAIYKHDNKNILIQHGSYQIIDDKNQPELDKGFAILYRGIGKDKIYKQYRISNDLLKKEIMNIHAKTLADSDL